MANPVASLRREVRELGSDDPAGVVCRALLLWCPGCADEDGFGTHRVVVEAGPAHDGTGPVWEWDGNLEAPTISPSLLVTGVRRCHSYIVGGVWQYLDDCTHPLAGQHVPLPPLPDWLVAEADRA